ncbi:MAG: dehydrogenase, partial [Phycisphaerales bacterium]|nr:dehydrogenase [Phycisphaerales bacterium]
MRSRTPLALLGSLSLVGGLAAASPWALAAAKDAKPAKAAAAKPRPATAPSTQAAYTNPRLGPIPKEMDVESVAVPPAPPLKPEDAIKTIKVAPGYRIELVAAEPLVQDPISIHFDGDGRLWVCEMRGYMPDVDATNEEKPIGRVSILEDTDGDGKMDKQTIFADGLVLPRVATPYRDGAFVASPPNLWFMRDANGDGKADERQLLATDYTNHSNPEHQPNGMLPALDNWVYNSQWPGVFRYVGDGYPVGLKAAAAAAAMPTAGGVDAEAQAAADAPAKVADAPEAAAAGKTPPSKLTKASASDGAAAAVAGKFTPPDRHWVRVNVPGKGQWGISQDDVGRLYTNGNSDNARVDQVPARLLSRNPSFPGPAGANVNPSAKGDKDWQKTYPIHPTPGVNRGYQSKVLTEDGYLATFTAACSPHAYRGDLLKDYRGDLFVCEPSANLIKRNHLQEKDGLVVATNTSYTTPGGRKADFVASTDERFRPVFLADGPDGALYVADLYRGILQHKKYVTPYLRKQILQRDLEAPLHMGRIYRIVPENYHRPAKSDRPNMSKAPVAELVKGLSHPNGWWRDQAQQALVARNDPAAAAPLVQLVTTGSDPFGRLHALYALEGLRKLDAATVAKALADADARVRAAAARLAEPLLREDPAAAKGPLLAALVGRAADEKVEVRRAVLMSAGTIDAAATAKPVLDALAADAAQPYVADAFVSGTAGRELDVLKALLAHPAVAGSAAGEQRAAVGHLIGDLAGCIVREGKPERVQALLAAVGDDHDPKSAWRTVALLTGMAPTDPKEKPKPVTLSAEPAGLVKLASADDAGVKK